MVASMSVVGNKFSAGEIFVPEMPIAAKAMSKGVEVLKLVMAGNASSSLGTCIMGTVAGHLHDIEKNLVIMMLESSGFEMVDLGVDVPAEIFVQAIKDNNDDGSGGAHLRQQRDCQRLRKIQIPYLKYKSQRQVCLFLGLL